MRSDQEKEIRVKCSENEKEFNNTIKESMTNNMNNTNFSPEFIKFLEYIWNNENMKKVMEEYSLDLNRLPMGRIT